MRRRPMKKRSGKAKNRGYKCFCDCHKLSALLDGALEPYKEQEKRLLKNLKNCKRPSSAARPESPEYGSQYVIYCIVNGSYFTSKGFLTASVARSFLNLYSKTEADRTKVSKLWKWEDNGEMVVVLNGVNHGHLKYLTSEMRYAAVATDLLMQKWAKSQIILVLSALGRYEDLEEVVDGLEPIH